MMATAAANPDYTSADGGASALSMMKDCNREVAEYCANLPNNCGVAAGAAAQMVLKKLER